MNPQRFLHVSCLMFLAVLSASAYDDARLLRFPAIHGDNVVFSYAGDLYTVSASGGVARKLTNDAGYEMFARFSPDGKSIAFTGQYDGNTEVYVMPSEGGIPRRVTYTATLGRDDVSDRMGPNNIVMTWRDNSTIIYRSRMHESNDFIGQLYSVSLKGGLSEQLPLPRGGFCSFSSDGNQMAYNRVFREFRTWKRYRGGQADEIWIYDFTTKKITNTTENPAQDIIPMWAGNKIYFASDRDQRMNLFVYDLTTKQTKKLTNFTEFDVKFPSLGDNAIVFENGGYLYKLDLASEQVSKITVSLREDLDVGRGGIIDVSKNITNFEISPDGKRALFGARGDLFTVPAEHGATRNLTATSGVHERNSKWSPDGKWISYVGDESGEDEIYIRPQDGSGEATRLTKNADTYKYQPLWSPDSKKLLWSDKKLRLQYVDIDTKEVTIVADAKEWEMLDYSWSPDSRWIAYSQIEQNQLGMVYLYSVDQKKSYPATDSWFSSYGATFSSDGKYLFFVSDRSFNPVFSATEWNHAYVDMGSLYLLTLAGGTKSPFEPKDDEVSVKTGKEEGKEEKKDEAVKVKVDIDGLQQRIAAIPVDPSSYSNLTSVGDKLYYTRSGSKDAKPKLLFYDLEKQKETELGEFGGFEISADGKKMIIGSDQSYFIIDLPTAKIEAKDKLDLSDLKVNLDRKAEWNQIFAESWRQMRDFLYDPHLHGVDWPKVRETYGQLLPFVNHRADLTYIIGEMIGELSLGHTYVGGGDYPKAERIQTGQLGAVITRDPASGYYQVKEILKGQNWEKDLRSPLTEIGVDVHEGDYIISVDGKPTNTMDDIYASLVGKAGKQVTLEVNAKASKDGTRKTIVEPIADERELYYYRWVEGNIGKVNKATDGKVGYIHVPDMGVGGLNEFVKHFYPQTRKDGLIIDVRGNGGGNVSPMIIERLMRKMAMIDIARNTPPSPDPGAAVLGPEVMLIDEFSASDGDIVGYRFRKAGLGQLIGKRTWGGVVGIRGSLPLLDGGFLMKPEFSRYNVEGTEWIMEGKGVEPDIYVDNDPATEFAGTDQQLNKAIEVILDELKKHPVTLPPPPPYPDKSK